MWLGAHKKAAAEKKAAEDIRQARIKKLKEDRLKRAALWKRNLPGNVRAGIASIQFNHNTFREICQKADDIFLTTTKPCHVLSNQHSRGLILIS